MNFHEGKGYTNGLKMTIVCWQHIFTKMNKCLLFSSPNRYHIGLFDLMLYIIDNSFQSCPDLLSTEFLKGNLPVNGPDKSILIS